MDTRIIKIAPEKIDEKAMAEMGKIISDGGLVAFPTETVYGLGANAFCAEAVRNIFKAKGRPADNPLIVHVSCFDEVREVAREIPENAKVLFDRFSPGPLTVILRKSAFIPDAVTAGLDTVAVRIPSHPAARALIRMSAVPIAAPSANRSGKPSPTRAEHVINDMMGRIDAIIDGGACSVGLESTVVDMTGEHPVLLRPGGVTFEEIKSVLPDAEIDIHILKAVEATEAPKCPGMKYKHYAPDAEVYVVEGKREAASAKIKELISQNKGKRVGVIALGSESYNAELVLYAGQDNVEYANKLFDYLRECDKNDIDIVFAEFCYDDEYALAVKNRLYKAAANRIIRV
jgi:L-threonylcarbamoyladenylate synthase